MNDQKIDPVLKLLAWGILVFAGLVVAVSKWSPNDGQTFQVFSGVLLTLVGCFVGRIDPERKIKKQPDQSEGPPKL